MLKHFIVSEHYNRKKKLHFFCINKTKQNKTNEQMPPQSAVHFLPSKELLARLKFVISPMAAKLRNSI